MGGCTSKDKTVAENEGCVKHFFSSSSSLCLCCCCRHIDNDDDSLRWHTEVRAIFCFCAEDSTHSPSLSLSIYIFFAILPIPIFVLFADPMDDGVRAHTESRNAWLLLFFFCEKFCFDDKIRPLEKNILQFVTHWSVKMPATVRRGYYTTRIVISNYKGKILFAILTNFSSNNNNYCYAMSLLLLCWVDKYWYKLHTRIYFICSHFNSS